ncbi:hypothetical protein ACFYE2_06965, partial [Kocuria sp. CPCC 205300]|uniref:hypothetical protein n=1 Tax=Kocuria sabuli TaxID=3071448 RepID=UPI0036DBC202
PGGGGGGGGSNPGGGGGGGGSNPGGGGGGGGSNPVQYTWTLPPSDISVTGNDGPAYAALRRSCQEGQNYLDSVAPSYGFQSPRNVVLFVAGIRICNGDLTGGQVYYNHAQNFYGLEGLAPEGVAECDLYKSVRSVLEQRPREEFVCPGGSPPGYKFGETGLRDDPVTLDIDESIPQTPDPVITSDSSPAPAISVSEPAE